MKTAFVVTLLIALGLLVALVQQSPSAEATRPPQPAPRYEYNVMSLMEMFKDSPNAEKMRDKIGDIMVQGEEDFNRTDMDVPDYEAALNRLAKDGWELVTVNKSNYWVFRRPVRKDG